MNIKRQIRYLFLLLFLIFFFFSALSAQIYNTVEVSGRVVLQKDDNVVPVPGLSVSLVSKKYGRSVAKITDNKGRFSLKEVPLDGNPFYLEVYSNAKLLYRKSLNIRGDTDHEVRLR